ncbi:MAG: hypothetical protein ACOC23_02050 [Thermodesulfobacteriota bacterium]
MTADSKKTARLTALFLLGWLLFNYPLLSLFSLNRLVFGVPFLYFYIFCVWVFLILSAALVTRIKERKGADHR